MRQIFRSVLAAALAGLLCLSALAADAELHIPKEAVAGESLQSLIEAFMEQHYLTDRNFSLAYYNTVTGEEFCFNEETMMTAASTYKLPLNLYYYEMQEAGEISGDELFLGHTLDDCHYQSIVWSDNELSQEMLYALGGFHIYKDCMRTYFTMTDEEIDPLYYDGNYYCTRMMLDTLKYLYSNSDRFPELLDYMQQALPDEYFKKYVTDVPIAHKYGCFEGAENDVGIFYTEQPFLLAVYTQDVGVEVVSEAAALLRTYNECRLEADRQQEQARVELRKEAEQAALRRAEERAAQEQALAAQREAEAQAKTAAKQAAIAAEQPARSPPEVPAVPEQETPAAPEREEPAQAPSGAKKAFVWWVPVIALVIFGLGLLILPGRAGRSYALIDELDREDEADDVPKPEEKPTEPSERKDEDHSTEPV